MRMKLKQLEVENFGGIKKQQVIFGDETTISGPNGAGKTRLQSAFSWLLYDKDVSQRTKFEVRPLDKANRPIQGLVISVEATLEFLNDDETAQWEHTFRKEEHERIVKDEHRGYTRKYFIDGVPKKESEYQKEVSDIISDDRCRILTDLMWFCGGMPWTMRRAVLYDMIGEMPSPEGFDDLLERTAGRSIIDYRKVLRDRRTLYVKQRDQIPYRIDELTKRCTIYEQIDDAYELEEKREFLREEIADIVKKRRVLVASESKRQNIIDERNRLIDLRATLERKVKEEASSDLTRKAVALRQSLSAKNIELLELRENVAVTKFDLTKSERRVDEAADLLKEYRSKFIKLKNADLSVTCDKCGQKLPKGQIDEIRTMHELDIENIKSFATKQKTVMISLRADMLKLQEQLESQEKMLLEREEQYKINQIETTKQLTDIEKQMEITPEPDYAINEKWSQFTRSIQECGKRLGSPVSEEIGELDIQKAAVERDLETINDALHSLDQSKRDNKRIEELKTEQRDVSQAIADIDKELSQIAAYTFQESLDIEQAVNELFDEVQFKLFDFRLNSEVDDKRCDATYNGVPFSDLSTGEQIMVGVSVVKTLSQHYDTYLPLFIDHAESITLDVQPDTQIIWLRAEDVPELTITTM